MVPDEAATFPAKKNRTPTKSVFPIGSLYGGVADAFNPIPPLHCSRPGPRHDGRMKRLQVGLGNLDKIIASATAQARQAIEAGARASARRLQANFVIKTPKDSGLMKAAWQTVELNAGNALAQLINSAPYAGIVEEGARPHPVSQEGREPITLWVRRQMSVNDEEEVQRILEAIVNKLQHHGQKGTFFVRDALKGGTATKFLRDEIYRRLAQIDPCLHVGVGRNFRG